MTDTRPPIPKSESHGRGEDSAKRAVPSDIGDLDASAAAESSASSSPATMAERVVLDDTGIHRALMRIAHEIVESNPELGLLYLVAIPNGGVPLARRLAGNLESLTGCTPRLGILDTTLYRDDLSTRGMRPRLRRTEMPSSVDEGLVILVEDVVSTGRTIRAGMDALMDFGRPRSVKVVALVDRGHRELPIKIDYVGKNIPTQPGESVVFRAEMRDEPEGESLEVVVQTQEGVAPGLETTPSAGELA